MSISDAVLEQSGLRISPVEFDALVIDAFNSLVPRREVDAATLLTADQMGILEQLGVDARHRRPEVVGPLGPIARGATQYAVLVASSLSVPAVAQRLHVDESRVRQRITKRSLYAFKPHARWLLPLFQFEGAGTLPGIERVVPKLNPALSPLTVAMWFQRPDPNLVDASGTAWTPRNWLLAGYSVEPVAESASFAGVLG